MTDHTSQPTRSGQDNVAALREGLANVSRIIAQRCEDKEMATELSQRLSALHELLAYLELGRIAPDVLSHRSRIIVTYALCGFANFGSLGIMIGGMGAMSPDKRPVIIQLGFRSILAGTIATCMTGAVVGIVL